MHEPRVFLLSPAHCAGKRAELLFRAEASFPLAQRLRTAEGVTLGEAFSFVSGLYFRGKLAYAGAFADPPAGVPPALVITTNRGLMDAEERVTLQDLRDFGRVSIDLRDPLYREPLLEGVRRLRAAAPASCRFVLLGSIATAKYVELLLDELGPNVCFPEAFVGMGDMQRGALMLRAAEAGVELPYIPAAGAIRSRAAAARRTGVAR